MQEPDQVIALPKTFPEVQISRTQDTKTRFNLVSPGGKPAGHRIAAAVSSMMGLGGDIIVLDDPHSLDEAESDNVRDEAVRKLRLALFTRDPVEAGGHRHDCPAAA